MKQRNSRKLLVGLLLAILLPLLALAGARAWTSAGGRPVTGDGPVVSTILDQDGYPWVFLRDGQALAGDETLASVIAVGDIMLGRGVPAEPSPWLNVAGWLPSADLTLGNLESVLTEGRQARSAPAGQPQPILLRAEPEAARPLAEAGFDILGLANNHALDYGPDGLADTAAALQDVGLSPIGLLATGATQQPLIQEANGLRLAFLAYNAVPDPQPDQSCAGDQTCQPAPAAWDSLAGPASIAAARRQAQAVIVSIHWGFEYQVRPDPYQEAIAEQMLAAGADLVVGHHPHVGQPVVVSRNRLVAYSLGNFVFDQSIGDTSHGLVLRAFFDGQGLRAVQLLPLQAGPQPRLLAPEESQSFLSLVLPEPARLGFRCDGSTCQPVAAPQARRSGLFYGGQIDLTGDGRPETVRREGARIAVYDDASIVWLSPEKWQVVDAALGDPNDDGRYEIMLALWQEDAAGYPRSQPYIVGYRGGEYRLLWGGRPVVDPIQEVAVGDVDGNGVEELVVIEERAGGSARAVSVWRWTGWTFTLLWRSDNGLYRDLVLVEDDRGAAILTVANE